MRRPGYKRMGPTSNLKKGRAGIFFWLIKLKDSECFWCREGANFAITCYEESLNSSFAFFGSYFELSAFKSFKAFWTSVDRFPYGELFGWASISAACLLLYVLKYRVWLGRAWLLACVSLTLLDQC